VSRSLINDGLARRGGFRRAERNLKIGIVLVRDYQGRRHTVTVTLQSEKTEGERVYRVIDSGGGAEPQAA
jgi:hypothetical protein